jgi:peptidoglycan/xylan/chitin deacetylase (PgdA/CDA1 family)
MTQSQKNFGSPAAEDLRVPIALPRAATFTAGPYQTIAGKVTRFLARNVPTKPLTMRNTRPLVSFTFDDAAASACTTGAMLLEQHQVRGTFYISGGKCGTASPTGLLATTDQVKTLHADGHEIGCHTFSHLRVVDVDFDALDSDLDRNRKFLRAAVGDIPIDNFAYPYGYISFKAKRHLGQRYESCRAMTTGVNAGTADLAVLKCYPLEQTEIDRQTITRVIAEAVRRTGWALFASHDVAGSPSPYGVQPDLLAFALRSALAAGCDVVTVSQALRLARGAQPNGTGCVT